MKLQDSVIAITGGGQGLGRAMAEYLAAKGAKIALIDLMEDKLAEAAEACKKAGSDAKTYVCNVAKEDDVEATFQAIINDFGHLNGLVNNAGILGQKRSWLDLEAAEIERLLRINVTGPMLATKAFLNARALDTPGAIVNMASIAGENGGAPGFAAYGASKGALLALTRAMARDLAPELRVNALAPGIIQTAMQTGAPGGAANAEAIPLGRAGSAEEVAGAAEWLLLDAPYTSGEVLRVAGGRR